MCGVYTQPSLVNRILDRVGWTSDTDLSATHLLEPSAGDGAFIVEAAKRLVDSYLHYEIPVTIDSLRDRILAYELVPREAKVARQRVSSQLISMGVHHATARACARSWIRNEDFLLADLQTKQFSHIVGNPPYVRWSKIPNEIKRTYAKKLKTSVSKGDLYLPFLHTIFESLGRFGRCVLVCSDRWHYNAYAEEFKASWDQRVKFHTEPILDTAKAFNRDVNVQTEILTIEKIRNSKFSRKRRRATGQTLQELGCSIRVGPALGVTAAFVIKTNEAEVESDLLHRWVDTKDVRSGSVHWSGRRVVSPFDSDGNLVKLEDYPLLESHLRCFEKRLRSRYIVRMGAEWYRTIEKIQPQKWSEPKLLIPDFAKTPRVALDYTGVIPSHAVYAIFHQDNKIDGIYERLNNGKLAESLSSISPTVRGGYRRCYRRFLERIRL